MFSRFHCCVWVWPVQIIEGNFISDSQQDKVENGEKTASEAHDVDPYDQIYLTAKLSIETQWLGEKYNGQDGDSRQRA